MTKKTTNSKQVVKDLPKPKLTEKEQFALYVKERNKVVEQAKVLLNKKSYKKCLSLLMESNYKDKTVQGIINYCKYQLNID